MNEFDLRNFLYNNPLLKATIRENEEEKDEASKKALDKKEDELDKKDMEHETLKDKIKHHEGAIKNIKKELEDLSDDLGEDEEDLKQEKKDVKETALRKAIQNEITSILQEAEEDEEDTVNVDVDKEEDINVKDTKTVNVDDESEESKIEVDSELAGEDADTAAILGLLTKAQQEAEGLGDEKLMDQIGNTITYYTRAHVVKSTETRAVAEDIEISEALFGLLPDIKKGERLEITGSQGVGLLEKVKKGEYKHIGDTKLFGHTFKNGEKFRYAPGEKIAVKDNYGSFGVIKKLRNASTGKEYKKIKL